MHDCPDMNTDKRTAEGYIPPTCLPCWNRHLNEKFHPDYIPKRTEDVWVDTNISELIEQLDMRGVPKPYPQKKCQFYTVGRHDIILSAKTEFFHPAADDIPFRIMRLLSDQYPRVAERCRILTKQKLTKPMWKKIPKSMLFGASITTLNSKESKIVQPAASSPRELIQMLRNAHKVGFMTWVVVEPFYKRMILPKLLRMIPFVNEVWVGRLNYGRNIKVLTDMIDDEVTLVYTEENLETLAKDDDEICLEFVEALEWAKDNAPQMKIRPKREILKLMLQPKYADQIKLVPL